jgi:hypothetical protein
VSAIVAALHTPTNRDIDVIRIFAVVSRENGDTGLSLSTMTRLPTPKAVKRAHLAFQCLIRPHRPHEVRFWVKHLIFGRVTEVLQIV